MAARNDRIALTLLAVLVGVAAQACKTKEKAEAPGQVQDDIATIDALLAERDRVLQDEGIVVAYRQPTLETPIEPAPDGEEIEAPPEPEPDREVTPAEPIAPEADAPQLSPAKPSTDVYDGVQHKRLERRRTGGRERRKIAREDRSRCERVCELADTTCGLHERVCSLAEDHPDDARYEAACRRAEDQCDAARRHCESCAA
jgi:hypothetical protein